MDIVVIRPGRAEDLAEIQEFTKDTFDWGDYVADAYAGWISAMERGDSDVYVAVSMPAGRVVGVNHTRYISPVGAWFEGIRVHPDFRRAGIGRLLTVAAIEGARRRGMKVCRAAIDGDNVKSQGLARSYGFEPVVPVIQFDTPLDNILRQVPLPDRPELCLRDAVTDDAAAVFAAVSREMVYIGSDYTWWRVTPENLVLVIAQRQLRLAVDATGTGHIVAGATLSEPFFDEHSDEPVVYGEMSSPFGDWSGVTAIAREYAERVSCLASAKGSPAKLSIICEGRSSITGILPRHGFAERFLEGRRDEIWLWELLLDPDAIVK